MGLFVGRECKQTWRKAKWNVSGEFLKLFVHKGTQQLACLVVIQGGCSTCSPKQSHNCSAPSSGPRPSLFSEVSYGSKSIASLTVPVGTWWTNRSSQFFHRSVGLALATAEWEVHGLDLRGPTNTQTFKRIWKKVLSLPCKRRNLHVARMNT